MEDASSIMSGEKKEAKSKIIEERIQKFSANKYAQSSKASSLGRTIIYAIIGLIWALSYKPDSGFSAFDNIVLGIAFFLALVYLFVDISHYFADTIGYDRLSTRLESPYETDTEEILKEFSEAESLKLEKRSLLHFKCKFIFMIITVVVFVSGMILEIM